MNEKLKSVLMKGETIQWSGRPEKGRLLDASHKTAMLVTWLISAVVVIAATIFLLPSITGGSAYRGESMALLAALCVAPVLLSIQPWLDKRRLENDTYYAITNCRVITVVKGEVSSLPLNARTQVRIEDRQNGCGNICFDAMIGQPVRKSRALGVLGARDLDKALTGIMLYQVKNPDLVCNGLKVA